MAEVKVLIEGYAKQVKNGWLASSSATLVRSKGKNIIVDPGCNRKRLLAELSKQNLRPEDINYVLLTHSHTDHTLLAGIFEKARVLNSEEIYNNDAQIEHNNKIPGTSLEIIQTPGHSPEHCSLIAKTEKGVYAIAGDVFWWMDNEKQAVDINKADEAHPKELDMKKLIASRKRILEIADFVIPGHGKTFKVRK